MRWIGALGAPLVAALTFATGASAANQLKLAIGPRGNWENAAPHLGQQAGIFKKHGLDLEFLYTHGAGETMQAVLSGSVDIGIGVGTPGVMSAFAKALRCAPLRIPRLGPTIFSGMSLRDPP